ncbi:hypothetical protein BJM39_24380 [Salmonella enterica subsp. enterica serovar Javiana]|nr:hypothetical protein BJM39_24380 [Salmonella enterica subsp. enterica serovar Javiana]
MVRGPEEHVELGVVDVPGPVVRVAEVVHGHDQWLVVLPEGGDEVAQVLRRERIEAEVQVHDVELTGVLVDPRGGEHGRRPPGRVGGVARPGVGEPADGGSALGPGHGREVADIDVS